jgi:hypothetical protein
LLLPAVRSSEPASPAFTRASSPTPFVDEKKVWQLATTNAFVVRTTRDYAEQIDASRNTAALLTQPASGAAACTRSAA